MSKTLFTASAIWKGPEDNEPFVYFGGITQNLVEDIKLEDSGDLEYAAGTSFKLIGTSKNNLGRLYRPFSKDNLVISNVPNNIEYRIDDEKNLVIFPQNFPLSIDDISTIRCKYYENYASIFKSNLVSFDKVIDFRFLREKAITSMLATDDGIFIACVCGSLWFFDGYVIKGPVFKMEEDIELPATCLLKHKFYHEDEDYIYIASDKKQRLYRSKISSAKNGMDWEKVYGLGELNTSSGGILSMTSAFNKIFLGCRNNKVLIYSRSKELSLVPSDDVLNENLIEVSNIIESLEVQELKSSNLGDFEPITSDIRCIESARNEVFVGLSNKSEIWAYQEIFSDNPDIFENWSHYTFDETFKNDPAPAQYYNYDSNTFSRNDINLGIARYYDSSQRDYVKEILLIKGNTISSSGTTVLGQRLFEFSDGSDWEQLSRLSLPSQDFFEIQCATIDRISLLNDFISIDGYELNNYDLVLVKNQLQNDTITNGIYQYLNGSLSKYNNFVIFENSIKLGFYIKNGDVNKNRRYFCTVDSFETASPIFTRSKYTFEIETKNLAYSTATGATNFKTAGVLNSLLNNEERILSSTGYTGFQGFEVADYYGTVSVQYNDKTLRLKSGNNIIEKALPIFGSYKNWTFSSSSSIAATTDNWQIVNFVDSMIGSTESVSDQFSNTYTRYFLRINPSLKGDSSIQINNLNLTVDPEATFKFRAKIIPKSSFGFDNSKINLYWSTQNNYFPQKISIPIQSSDDYIDYELKPIWKDKINSIRLEFANLPEDSLRPTNIDLDYIKIENEKILFDLNNSFSKIRLTVEDKDIKVWLGKQYYPFINSKNFILTDNYNKKYLDENTLDNNFNKPFIRFGKIDKTSGNSLFGYSHISYYMGENYEPYKIQKYNFYNTQKLSSTGGVRFFTYHDGTIYCATDGFDSNNVNVNPDDRQSKVFAFNYDNKSWERSDLTFERKQIFNDDGTYNLLGIVRPLNLTSYKDLLYLSGQYANIKVV